MKNITVGFSYHPGSPLSWLIRVITKSKVSHVFAVVVVAGDPLVYQASGLNVNYTALPVFLEKNKVVEQYNIEISEEQYAKARKIRVSQVGKPYSLMQLVGFLWVLGMRKFGRKVRNPLSDGKQSYVCVEIIADMIDVADGEAMTPEDFRRYCKEHAR